MKKIALLCFIVCKAASAQPPYPDPTPALLIRDVPPLVLPAPAPSVLDDLALKYRADAVAPDADRPLIVYLPGHGGSERGGAATAAALPTGYTLLTVRAPLPLSRGYQWFQQTFHDGLPDGDPADVQRSTKLLTEFIAGATAKYRTRPDRVLVVGMSQGAMMAYAVALRHPELLRGAAALSGSILPVAQAVQAPPAALQKLTVFIGHGTADRTVPYARATDADATLRTLGVTPAFHAYFGMKHATRKDEIADLAAWMRTLFGEGDVP